VLSLNKEDMIKYLQRIELEGKMTKPWVKLREVSADEAETLRRLAKSRTESVRKVQRVRLIVVLRDNPQLPASDAAKQVGFGSDAAGPMWVRRFNAEGIAGLEDKPRSGAPVTHTETVRSQVINLALQKPTSLGYPFALWSLSRLQSAIQERHGLHLALSTLWEWLDGEGLDWKRQQTWFQEPERHDPEFVEKRGPSSGHM
jgi:transposase